MKDVKRPAVGVLLPMLAHRHCLTAAMGALCLQDPLQKGPVVDVVEH